MLILRIRSNQKCFTSQPSFRSITLCYIRLFVRPFISCPSLLTQQQTISVTWYFATTHTRSFARPDACSHTKIYATASGQVCSRLATSTCLPHCQLLKPTHLQFDKKVQAVNKQIQVSSTSDEPCLHEI